MPPKNSPEAGVGVRIGARWPLASAAALATASLYAEGVLKNGWIEVLLLGPVLWYLLAPSVPSMGANLLVSLLAACLSVSALDLALRPLLGQRLHYTPTNIFPRKLPTLPIVGRWDPDVDKDMEAYGDLAAIAQDPSLRETRKVRFETDAAGFRNHQEKGPFDVIVLGDSFSAGVGTTQERVFSSLLQQRGRHVYNLSYPGGPYDQFVNFAIEWPRLTLTPDALLIWTLYVGNDLDDGYGATWDPQQFPRRSGLAPWAVRFRTFRNRSPLNQIMQGLQARWVDDLEGILIRRLPDGRPMLFVKTHEAWGQRSRQEVEAHPNFPKLEKTLLAMRSLAGARRLPMVLLIFPTKGEVYRWVLEGRPPKPEDGDPSGFALAVLEACRRSGIACLDAKPALLAAARQRYERDGALIWWRDDTHFGEAAHEAVADLILNSVLRDGARVRPAGS